MERRHRNLKESLEEAERSLNEFVEILSIAPQQIKLTDKKLGTGAYAGFKQTMTS